MRAALLSMWVLCVACPAPRPCTPLTCEGCCVVTSPQDPGTCQPGTTTDACGSAGAMCARCEAAEFCSELRICRGPDEPLPSGAKLVFATSATFTGALGGRDGGDGRCQAVAADAGLPGTFLVYLSDVTETGERLPAAARFTGNGPWVMRTRDARGKVLRPFDDAASLSRPPRSPIDQDETGRVFTLSDQRQVWTGTLLDGGVELPAPGRDTTCARWTNATATGLYGIIDVPTDKWSGLGAVDCGSENRLYCFEQ